MDPKSDEGDRSQHRGRRKSRSESKKRKRRQHSSSSSTATSGLSSSDSSSSRHRSRSKKSKKKLKRKEHKKSKRRRNSSTQSSSSESERERKSRKKKKSHKTKKKKKHKSNEDKPLGSPNQDIGPAVRGDKVHVEDLLVKKRTIGPAPPKKLMKPMSKEEWEKSQSVIRRVFDPDTGRTRLVRGEGEIIEEIVSKERQKEINKQATLGDGLSFQAQMGLLKR